MLFTNFETYLKDVRGVIHVGAHDGEERGWYTKYPGVIYFEPDPKVFSRLRENIKYIKNHVAYNVGIHDTLKEAILHVASNEGLSSSILPLGTHKTHHPKVKYVGTREVKLVRLDEFLQSKNISIDDYNFLNIDVQGVELNVIKSLGELISKIDYIYTEVNWEELYEGCCLINQIDDYLSLYDFERVQTHKTKHMWGDAFYIKRKLI